MKRTVFLGTYTNGESKGIYSCRFDDETGTLTDYRLAAETPCPSYWHCPNGKFLYAVNETNDYGRGFSAVTAYAITDPDGGELRKLNTVSSHGAHPVISPSLPGEEPSLLPITAALPLPRLKSRPTAPSEEP